MTSVLRKAGDVLLPLEPGVEAKDNICKTCNESNEKIDESPNKRHRMSGILHNHNCFSLELLAGE